MRSILPCSDWRAIPGPLSKRKSRLDSLEAAQGAPRAPRRDSRGERIHCFIFPVTVYRGSDFSTSLPTLVIFCIFCLFVYLKNRHPNVYGALSHCSLVDISGGDTHQIWALLHTSTSSSALLHEVFFPQDVILELCRGAVNSLVE